MLHVVYTQVLNKIMYNFTEEMKYIKKLFSGSVEEHTKMANG